MDDEMIFTPSDTGIPEGGGPGTVTPMDEEMTFTPSGDIDTPYADRRMAGVPDPSAVATPYADARMAGGTPEDDDESLEDLEARLEGLRAEISEKRKAVRERVRQRRGAEATAPPSAGGAQTQAPATTGGGGVSYEGM